MKKVIKLLNKPTPKFSYYVENFIWYVIAICAILIFVGFFGGIFAGLMDINFNISNVSGQLRDDLQYLSIIFILFLIMLGLLRMEERIKKLIKKKK